MVIFYPYVTSGLGVIKRVRPYVPTDTLITIYNSIVKSHLEYCCEVWDSLGKVLSEKLQKFQNRAARLILGTDHRASTDLVLGLLNWKRLENQRFNRKAVMMHKIANNNAPTSLTELFTRVGDSTDYNLRGAQSRFVLPRPRTESLKKSFSYSGAITWNSLPERLRQIESVQSFKTDISRHSA